MNPSHGPPAPARPVGHCRRELPVRRTGDPQEVSTVLEDWEATALLVSDEPFVGRLQAPKASHEYIAWEEVLRADIPGDSAS